MDPHTGVVPSTLHQKIKFVTEGQLVCVFVEEDIVEALFCSGYFVLIFNFYWTLGLFCVKSSSLGLEPILLC